MCTNVTCEAAGILTAPEVGVRLHRMAASSQLTKTYYSALLDLRSALSIHKVSRVGIRQLVCRVNAFGTLPDTCA